MILPQKNEPKWEYLGENKWRAHFRQGDTNSESVDVTADRERSYYGNFNSQAHLPAYVASQGWLSEHFGDKRIKVLDAGCGSGYGTEWLSTPSRDVLGVDVSPEAIRFAQLMYRSEKSFRVCNLEMKPTDRLPFDDNEFDAIVSVENLEHIDNDARLLQELGRIMAPGGMLALTTPIGNGEKPSSEFHFREYTPDQLSALVDRTGWKMAAFKDNVPGHSRHFVLKLVRQ